MNTGSATVSPAADASMSLKQVIHESHWEAESERHVGYLQRSFILLAAVNFDGLKASLNHDLLRIMASKKGERGKREAEDRD